MKAETPQIHQNIKNMQNFQFSSKNVSISLKIRFFYYSVSLLGAAPISYQTVEIKHVEIRGLRSRDLLLVALREIKFSMLVNCIEPCF